MFVTGLPTAVTVPHETANRCKLRDGLPFTLQECLPTVEQLEMELEAAISELEKGKD